MKIWNKLFPVEFKALCIATDQVSKGVMIRERWAHAYRDQLAKYSV
jgi:hypothetical protein